ncbi:MAG: PH domain-containing protein [Marinicella sp.]|nr:PH domain-containing protein [Xanthomonadales bacterium]
MQTFEKKQLETSYLKIFRLASLVVVFFVSIALTIPISTLFDFGWSLRILCLLSFWIVLFGIFYTYSIHWYRAYHYSLLDVGLRIHKGVFWQQQHTVPRNRVQHIDITTGPLERRYELSKLVLHTAGTRNASVTLPGLLQDDATALRQELINTNNTEDTV